MNIKKKLIYWTGGLTLLLLVSILSTSMIGSVSIPGDTVLKILLNNIPSINIEQTWTVGEEAIINDSRMPRIFLAIIVGGMLSLSGVAYQGILHNPLAEPYILGVSSGAALGAAGSIIFLTGSTIGYFTIPLFAFLGALISLCFVLVLSNIKNQRENNALILAGVILQSLNGAILIFLITMSGDLMESIIFWMMGSLANRDWIDIYVLVPIFLLSIFYLYTQSRELNIMSLGERAATHLGMDVEKKKITILIVASFLAAGAVSIVGIIGFVGLVIPHLMRLLTGPDHRVLIPVSVIAGAIFLLWADTLARTVIPSRELPIGVITAFIGAPVFAYFLRQNLRGRS